MRLNFGQRLKALGFGLGLAFSGRAPEEEIVGRTSQAGLFPSLTNPVKKHGAAWLKMYGEHPWLHIAVSRIAENCAAVQWHLYNSKEKKSRKEITDHRFLPLFEQPSPDFSGYILRLMTQAWIELQGEAFWIFERNKFGVMQEMWPVPPTWVFETPRPDFPFFRINLRGKQYTPPETDIAWFKNPSLVDPYGRGKGAAESAGDDVESDEYAAKWQKRFFSNSARPDVVISTKSRLDEANSQRLKDQWIEKYSGFWNAFKPAVLDGDTTVIPLTKGQQEMDFVESRKSARDNIIGNFGIPLSVLGIVENVNRANAETGEYTFNKNIILPRCIFWRDEYNKILRREYGKGLEFDFDNPVPEDRYTKLNEANEGLGRGAITVNEWREKMGFEARKDGDVFLIPFSLVPTPTLRSLPSGAMEGKQIQVTRSYRRGISNEEWERRWTMFIRQINPRERNYRRLLTAFWQEQEDEVKAKITAASREFSNIEGKPSDFLFDSEKWGKKLNGLSKTALKDSLKAAGLSAMKEINSGVDFDLYDPKAVKYIEKRLSEHLGQKITDQVLNALQQELEDGYEAGEGIPQIMERVEAVYDAAKGYQAERLARTEIVGSSNYGAQLAYSQAGVELKSWMAALDERTRESHIEAHRQYQAEPIPVDAEFEVGDGAGPCPGAIGLAEEDINCRCTINPVIPEIEEE